MTYQVLALALALLLAWALGFRAGQCSRRDRSQTATVRDAINAFVAMGHDREAARTLVRQSGAAAMRKAGTWDA